MSAGHRICPSTGWKVDLRAQALIRAHVFVATCALLVGGVAALGVLLTRWQAVHLLDPVWFYRLLTVHGMNMLIFFILFFEMALLYFAGCVMLNCRLPAPRLGWAAFATMLVGALLVEYMMWSGQADVLYTSYVPLRAAPPYYLGVILFAVGALVVVGHFFAVVVVARSERTYSGSVPLIVFGAITAAIIAVVTLLHGALVYIPTWLWSIGLLSSVDPQFYRMVWWALGHCTQQINVAVMVSLWYLLGTLSVGGVVLNEKVSRGAFGLYILFISMASAHHLLVDPGLGPAWKVWNTSYFMYMAVLASMIHGFTVPAGIEVGQRLRGVGQGIFGWLRNAPWGDPGFSAMALSLVVFGFVGGITGVTFGTEQISIIAHNTLRIPGHFHSTVVSGTVLAFMGITYYVIPLIFRREVAFWPLARLQPWIFAGGMFVFSIAMTFAGSFGVPRRHWDISFTGAPFSVEFSPTVDLVIGVMAVGGLLGITGGAIYIIVTVTSVFFGRRLAPDESGLGAVGRGLPIGITRPPRKLTPADDDSKLPSGALGHAPGTMVLVSVFLLSFVVYYFVNWKLLSDVWKVG